MNILLISSSFLPNVGGVERITYHLAKEYEAKGHKAGVLTNLWPRGLSENENIAGVVVHRLPMLLPAMNLGIMGRFLVAVKQNTDRILKIISGGKYEIIHIISVGPNGFYALTAHNRAGLPLVTTFQGSDLRQFTRDSAFARWTLNRILDQSAAVTACSQDLLYEAVGKKPAWESKSRVIYNGIDPTEFDKMAEAQPYHHPRPYILGMGRLIHIKGFDLLIKAFELFREEKLEYDLILAGDGEERKSLEKLSEDLGLKDRVWFWGWADREDAIRLLRGCAFAVCPSRQEGMGIVCLEAGLAERPIVAANVGGIPEVVTDGENGILFEQDSVPGLLRAMLRLTANPDLARRLGQVGRIRAMDRFAWPAIADQYLEVYKSVVEKK